MIWQLFVSIVLCVALHRPRGRRHVLDERGGQLPPSGASAHGLDGRVGERVGRDELERRDEEAHARPTRGQKPCGSFWQQGSGIVNSAL